MNNIFDTNDDNNIKTTKKGRPKKTLTDEQKEAFKQRMKEGREKRKKRLKDEENKQEDQPKQPKQEDQPQLQPKQDEQNSNYKPWTEPALLKSQFEVVAELITNLSREQKDLKQQQSQLTEETINLKKNNDEYKKRKQEKLLLKQKEKEEKYKAQQSQPQPQLQTQPQSEPQPQKELTQLEQFNMLLRKGLLI